MVKYRLVIETERSGKKWYSAESLNTKNKLFYMFPIWAYIYGRNQINNWERMFDNIECAMNAIEEDKKERDIQHSKEIIDIEYRNL